MKNDNKAVKIISSVKPLGVQIDAELNFNLHIPNICRSAANQLNVLISIRQFLGFEAPVDTGRKLKVHKTFRRRFDYHVETFFRK